jgi:signal transduction histidine kinase
MTDPIRAESLRTLLLQIRSQTAATVVVTLYMIGTAWAFTEAWVILAWTAAISVVALVRFLASRHLLRHPPPDSALDGWARRYTITMAVTGMVWGAGFLLLAHPEQPITVALTLSCFYSVAAGSVPSCAYHPPAIVAIVIPTFAAVLGKLLATGAFGYILLGSASALYGLTMIAFCFVQARTLREGFRIRFENVELVEQLRVEKQAADDARHEAEQANLAKSQFLAAASHDLRQPLYALSLFSSSLEELRLDGSARDVVRRIQDSIGVMESSFEGLLDLSKLEAGIVRPRLEPVDVDPLFDRINQVFGPLAAARGLELRFRSGGERVLSDRALLEQVLSNLVSNALGATDKGGVLLAARPRGDGLRFEIWDTGRGIAPDDLERIFDDYVQLDNPQRDRRHGLGLGLAIARRSVALLDARIDVASRIGRGSRFGFSQDVCAGAEGAAGEGPAADLGVLRRGEDPMLVVEDDEDVRMALCDLLSRWGIDIAPKPMRRPRLSSL